MPFYWWTGSDIDPDRVAWQLDQLAAKGIGGVIIGYSHTPDGRLDHGDPEPFTPAWWNLLRSVVDGCAERGMTTGLQDYNLIVRSIQRLGAATPGLSGTLEERHTIVDGPGTVTLAAASAEVLAASAVRRRTDGATAVPTENLDLSTFVVNGRLTWSAPQGDWLISVVSVAPPSIHGVVSAFDPLHPMAAVTYIEDFLEPFVAELGDRLGRDFTVFFQDELEFGIFMPMWSPALAAVLPAAASADLARFLPMLWHELGEGTAEFRLAYQDAVVQLLENHFFRPVWQWHEEHGTFTAMDQLSRGDLRAGHEHYGDYMRTMRWFHAPGNDDPDLHAPRQVAAFKISSSIAHLYGRSRVWNEAHHSSGWGVSPRDIVRGLNVAFASGATNTTMHAVYYTTEGGWWEWAAPDFHFRQPWWEHSSGLWEYISRMAALLSAGHHICDLAVLDPTDDLVATGPSARSPEVLTRLLEITTGAGIDIDVINSESLLQAQHVKGTLRVARESYRLLLLPSVVHLRESVAHKLVEFVRTGGIVVSYGELPAVLAALIDPELVNQEPVGAAARGTSTLAPGSWHVVRGECTADLLVELLRAIEEPDFVADRPGIRYNHRLVDGDHVYLVVNDTAEPQSVVVTVRATGEVRLWNAWNGESVRPRSALGQGSTTRVRLDLQAGQAQILVLHPAGSVASDSPVVEPVGTRTLYCTMPLDDGWTARCIPVLDNRYGDFAPLPHEMGVETHLFSTCVDVPGTLVGPPAPTSGWVESSVGVEPRFLVLGPIPPDVPAAVLSDRFAAARQIDQLQPIILGGVEYRWRDYAFAETTGLFPDPMLAERMTGPHGLKGAPDDNFLAPGGLGDPPATGSSYWFWSTVPTPDGHLARLHVGSRMPLSVWVDGALSYRNDGVPPAHFAAWNLPDLRVPDEQIDVEVPAAGARMPILVAMTDTGDQPLRAHVAVGGIPPSAGEHNGRLRWWAGEHPAAHFEAVPAGPAATFLRVAIPPEAQSVSIPTSGRVTAWQDDLELPAVVEAGRDALDSRPAVSQQLDLRPSDGTTGQLILRITGTGHVGGAVLEGPLKWTTQEGPVSLSPWSDLGLGDFSGMVRYRNSFFVGAHAGQPVHLELTELAATVRVFLNDQPVATLLEPPWRCELTEHIRPGQNTVELEVSGTLANHYRHYPSPFALPDFHSTGMVGPVTITFTDWTDVAGGNADRPPIGGRPGRSAAVTRASGQR